MILPFLVFGHARDEMQRAARRTGRRCARPWRRSSSTVVIALADDHEGHHVLAALLVGHADHCRLEDPRILQQRGLDLGRADPAAGDLDGVV